VKDATAMTEALTCPSKLHGISFLSLSNNNIGDEGARVLVERLKSNSTLLELNLVNNKTTTTLEMSGSTLDTPRTRSE
jgi:hypothetical protein